MSGGAVEAEGQSKMYVGEGDAEDIIRWFKDNSRAQWLGFFVAGDRQYDGLLNDVLAHGAVFDVVSGSHIDLFLFGGGQRINIFGLGRDVWVDATPLTELRQGEDGRLPEIKHIGEINRSAVRVKQITKASAEATHGIAEILGLEVDDLPSLVLIRQDFDFSTKEPKLVLRTRGKADAEFLIEFIRSMRRVMERHYKAALMRIPTEGSIERDKSIVAKIKIERDAITKFAARTERQAVSLSELLGRSGIGIPAHWLASAILDASSSEQGLRNAAAEQATEVMQLEKVLAEPPVVEMLKRLDKARVAVNNARIRMKRFYSQLPSVDILDEYLALNASIFTELEVLVARFDRKISFKITIGTITRFFNLSTAVLDKTKKLIRTAAELDRRSLELLPGAGSGGEHPGCEAARMSNEPAGRRDFFVSFNQTDRLWATWIAWVLEEAGYSVFFQDWDFRGNFVEHMNRAHSHAHRTLAVLSDRYFGSDFALAEWSARFAQDPASREDRLVPVKVGPLTGENILGTIVYADLTDCPEGAAEERLLGRVRKAVDASYRYKPQSRPGFPGGAPREFPIKPVFPERGSEPATK